MRSAKARRLARGRRVATELGWPRSDQGLLGALSALMNPFAEYEVPEVKDCGSRVRWPGSWRLAAWPWFSSIRRSTAYPLDYGAHRPGRRHPDWESRRRQEPRQRGPGEAAGRGAGLDKIRRCSPLHQSALLGRSGGLSSSQGGSLSRWRDSSTQSFRRQRPWTGGRKGET